MNKIFIVGIGPGGGNDLTPRAERALADADLIVGYTVYINLLGEKFGKKEKASTPMRGEKERCLICFREARMGRKVAVVCGGDAGIYGLASLMYELSKDFPDVELEVIPGITAANAGAALLGAPINNDFCVISLSDLLTPWDKIEKRLEAAASGDFSIVIYNPSSRKRSGHLAKACAILLKHIEESRPCGYAENIGRDGEGIRVCTLGELRNTAADMFTTVYIGNSDTVIINGRLVAKRGYKIE